MSSGILQDLEPTGISFKVAFDSQENQRNLSMRFEWMEIFLQNIVQCNPIGKIPMHV